MTLEELDFPKSFFEDEVREGFFISNMMKRNWAAQIQAMAEVDRICKILGIKWFLDSGTLLGAVRHKGFIPWDDDVDIIMTRKDVNIFIKEAPKYIKEDHVIVSPLIRPDIESSVIRFNTSTRVDSGKEFLDSHFGFPYAAGVDIIVLDAVYEDKELEKMRKSVYCDIMDALRLCSADREEGKEEDEDKKKDKDIDKDRAKVKEKGKYKEEFKKALEKVEKETGMVTDKSKNMLNELCKINLKWLESLSEDDEKADKTKLCLYWNNETMVEYERAWYADVTYIPFEGIMMPAPIGYEDILKGLYGNKKYILKGGASHDYPGYEKQEKKFKERLGNVNYRRYTMTSENILSKREEGLKEKLDYQINLIKKLANTDILIRADGAQRAQLLINAQKITAGLIDRLSEVYDSAFEEGKEAILSLNRMAQTIFEAFEAWNDGCAAKISLAASEMEAAVNTSFRERKEILFLPVRADWWNTMEPVWKVAVADKKAKVKIMPVKWYDKSIYGEVGEAHEVAGDYPDDMDIISEAEYDISKKCPSCIVIQFPFDSTNAEITVDEKYFSYKLRKYTDKLIYIPCYDVATPKEEDSVSQSAIKKLIEQPAVAFSDMVILPTEGMRKLYIETLSELMGDDTKDMWEKKIKSMEKMGIAELRSLFG